MRNVCGNECGVVGHLRTCFLYTGSVCRSCYGCFHWSRVLTHSMWVLELQTQSHSGVRVGASHRSLPACDEADSTPVPNAASCLQKYSFPSLTQKTVKCFFLIFFPLQFFFPGWRYTVCCVRLDLNATRFEYFLFFFNWQWKNRVCVFLFLYMCLCFCGHVCFVLLLLLSQCLIRGIQCLLLAGDREWETATLKCVFGAPLFPQTPLSLVFPRPLNFFILFFFDIYADVKSIFSLGNGHRSTNVDTPYFFSDYCVFFFFY